ncbi:hypothetical protein Patl1_00567 [Pistacia atlantica]|uniref:Uncharacterized protein n=1 Tax=Pistacia atlantica TaxID=434234 RepID=A0ACC1CDL1_9ROSI|nr:hypothetical protein Patl1_00567 [Pistacia atlantica]
MYCVTSISFRLKINASESLSLMLHKKFLEKKISVDEAKAYEVTETLNVYSIASGQRINLSKSSLNFSCNTIIEVKDRNFQGLEHPLLGHSFKILGDSLFLGITKTQL